MPVDFLRAGNVASVVEKNVFVALDDSDAWIVEMFRQPVRAYENFRVHVTLAGDSRIDGRSIRGDCRPHDSLLKEESFKHNQTELTAVQV